MKTKQTVVLAATMSVVLLFANTGQVFAEDGQTEFKSATIEERWTKEVSRGTYNQVFDVCAGDNPIIKGQVLYIQSDIDTKSLKTDRISPDLCRAMSVQIATEDPNSIQIEFRANAENMQTENLGAESVKEENTSEESSAKFVQAHKQRGGQPFDTETKRVIFKVTAGDVSIKDGQITITAPDASMNKDVKNLFASKSSVFQVFMKVTDTNSVDVKLHE